MNILIVEDEIDLGEILCDYLVSENFSVSLVSDGELALQRIQHEPWDLILLDLMLPSRDGLSICQEVRKTSQVPIIMTTAKVEEIDRLVVWKWAQMIIFANHLARAKWSRASRQYCVAAK